MAAQSTLDAPTPGPGSLLGLGLTPADFSDMASSLAIMAYLVLEATDCGQVPRSPVSHNDGKLCPSTPCRLPHSSTWLCVSALVSRVEMESSSPFGLESGFNTFSQL